MPKLGAIFAVAASIMTFALAGPASAQELIFGHGLGPGNPRYDAAEKFKQIVEERTNGRVKIQHAAQATQGDDVEMLTALQLGSMAFSANAQGPLSNIVPEIAAIGLPFLFSNIQQAWEVLDGPIGQELARKTEQKGLVVLAYWDNGIRHVTNNVRPITKPGDLAGLKIRTPAAPLTIDTFKALGANPASLPFSEVYIALQQGVFDGQENPLMNIYSARLHEVQKYVSLTGHIYEATPVLASAVVWAGLPQQDQDIIRQAAVEAGTFQRNLVASSEAKIRQQIADAGVAINEVDQAPFKAATQPVYEAWQKKLGDIVARIRQAAEGARDAGNVAAQ